MITCVKDDYTDPSQQEVEEDGDVVHWKVRDESAYMKTAIDDFQLSANYVFWTELSDNEVQDMPVRSCEKELVCSFTLKLPHICVDIVSWQVLPLLL